MGIPGLSKYYRQFIPHFAGLMVPLTNVIKSKGHEVIKLGEEQKKASEEVKQALCLEVVLHTPDFSMPFVLQVDASGQALGAVLFQKIERVERLVAYASKKQNDQEKRYTTIKRECLALKWGVECFHYYLLGKEFMVIMNQPL